jgi:hypothetical protein
MPTAPGAIQTKSETGRLKTKGNLKLLTDTENTPQAGCSLVKGRERAKAW